MARSPATPRKTTSTQVDRVAKRLTKQQAALEKQMINDMNLKVVANGGRMPKLSDLRKLSPLTDMQANIFDSFENDPSDVLGRVFFGSAAVGKSFLAIYFGLKEILNPDSIYKRLIIIRSAVPGRAQGFLPGEIDAKEEIYAAPYHSICAELTNNKMAFEKLSEAGLIEFRSSSYLRSLTFSDSFIVCDEMQNFSWQEIFTVITRLGKNSQIVCCGDGHQCDLTTNKYDMSGLSAFLGVTYKMPAFRHFKFTPDDICRSDFVKQFVLACQSEGIN